MPYIEVGASKIYYEQHGSGPDLVLLRGVSGNHASWYQQIACLASRWRLTVFDARGFGNSTDNEELGREGFAADFLHLWNVLRLDGAVVLGQSDLPPTID